MRVLFVCLGNICRSPLADGLMRKKVNENKLLVEVDSAGTYGGHAGQTPDSRMISTAKKRGTDISFLRARQFVKSDFQNFDLIYVMDKSNYEDVCQLAPNEEEKSKVNFILNEIYPNSNREVPDPYYDGEERFDLVYKLLDEATEKIIEKLKK